MLRNGIDIDRNRLKRDDAVKQLHQFRALFEMSADARIVNLEPQHPTYRVVTAFIIATLLAADWYDKAMNRSIISRWGFAGISFILMAAIPVLMLEYPALNGSGQLSGYAALLTGVLAIQKSLGLWLDSHRQFGSYWRARAALRDLLYSLGTKWAGRATVPGDEDGHIRFDPVFVAEIIVTTAQARAIVRKEQQYFFDTYTVPIPDILSGLGGAQGSLQQVAEGFGSKPPGPAAEGSASAATPSSAGAQSPPIKTAHFSITASTDLAQYGTQLVQAVGSTCEGDLQALMSCFPGVPPPQHALSIRLAGPSFVAALVPAFGSSYIDRSFLSGLTDEMAYDVPNYLVDYVVRQSPVPIGVWRAINYTQNAYYKECFIDELAHVAGTDPYLYRRRLLQKSPKNLAVLDAAAKKADWGNPLPPGVYRGIAVNEACGSYCAQVVEASIVDGSVRVHRVVAAIDCGHVVNPLSIEMQTQGAIVYALTAALTGEITIKNGAAEQGNFDDYEMLRIADAPVVETVMVPSGDFWGGVGEPPVPPLAPAVCNAVFAATGKRIRSLPLRNHDLRKAI